MQVIKSPLLVAILLLVQVLTAQEWSSRIAIVEAHLIDINFSQEGVTISSSEETYKMAFLQDGGDVFTVQNRNLSGGINVMFEEDLDSGFSVKDLFAYNACLTYDIGRFGLSFVFENFLNINQRESGLLPMPEYFGNDVVNATNYELDTPFSLALGLSFSF